VVRTLTLNTLNFEPSLVLTEGGKLVAILAKIIQINRQRRTEVLKLNLFLMACSGGLVLGLAMMARARQIGKASDHTKKIHAGVLQQLHPLRGERVGVRGAIYNVSVFIKRYLKYLHR